MRILVTGAAGFLGAATVDTLLQRNDVDFIVGVDNFSRSFLDDDLLRKLISYKMRFRLIKRDYRNITTSLLDDLEPDIIIHFAAFVSIDESMESPAKYFENNEWGTFKLAQALLRTKAQPRLIFASSPEVYGTPKYTPMDEEHPIHPRSTYSVTKLAAEKHCLSLFEWYGFPVTVIRNFNTYGEHQNLGGYSGVIPIFVERALKDQPLIISGDGSQTRDFLYVKDNAQAYSLLVDKAENLKGEIFNIGTGKQTSINDLAKMIIELADSNSEIAYGKPRLGDLPALCADYSKIRDKLGWEPKFTLEEGLRRTIKWYRNIISKKSKS